MIQKLIFFIILSLFNISAFADENLDQWYDTDKTYFDLILEGFEVKGYNSSTINLQEGLIYLVFVTVLQKNTEVYECHEYQTLNTNLQTLDMSVICRKLVQPYIRGIGT